MKQRKYFLAGLALGCAVLGSLFASCGYLRTWRLWNITAASPAFADIRVLTDGAETYREGIDPMVSNPHDAAQRRLNYPRVWQSLYRMASGPMTRSGWARSWLFCLRRAWPWSRGR